jgi:hypothetical protein
MPLLRRDPTGRFDAAGAIGASPTVFIRSDAATTLEVTAATVNGFVVSIAAGLITLPALQAGTNVLMMTVAGPRTGDDVQLMEDCGGGAPSTLKRKFVGAAPGGANPVVGFNINAS